MNIHVHLTLHYRFRDSLQGGGYQWWFWGYSTHKGKGRIHDANHIPKSNIRFNDVITLGHQNLKSMNIWLKCTCMSLWLPVIFLMHFVTETPLSQWGFERGAWKWCTCSFHCGKHKKINAKKIKLLVLVYTCINPVFFKIFTLYIGKNTGTVGGIWSACEQVTSLSWGHRLVIVNLWFVILKWNTCTLVWIHKNSIISEDSTCHCSTMSRLEFIVWIISFMTCL